MGSGPLKGEGCERRVALGAPERTRSRCKSCKSRSGPGAGRRDRSLEKGGRSWRTGSSGLGNRSGRETGGSNMSKVWLITGASRGMGIDFAKAALAAGHAVVATGRNTDAVAKAVGASDDLLVVKLDITSRADAEASASAAVDRFGRIDVLVNNAANFYAGYFEEL